MAVRRAFAPVVLLVGLLVVGQLPHLSRCQTTNTEAGIVSDGLQAKTLSLAQACLRSKDARYLVANLTKCTVNSEGSPNTPVDLMFELPPIDADERDFDMFISLRTSVGGVTMSLKYLEDPKAPPAAASTLYSTSVKDPQEVGALTINRMTLGAGVYWLHIETTSPSSRFTVRVFTPSKPVTMAPADVKALALLYKDCCPRGVDTCMLCERLQNAINPARVPEVDLCNMPPNMCDTDGRLFRLVLRPDLMRDNKPLVCAANRVPVRPLSLLTRLEFLDLSNHGLGGSVDDLAGGLAPLSELETIFLNNNAISGELSCDLISQRPVRVLRLRSNQIAGTIPGCFLASPNLTTLDLARNALTGAIPEITGAIPLATLNLRNQSGDGLSGSLPKNLASASQLLNLDIVYNSIGGTIPPLPSSLEMAFLDHNQLTGSLPPTANLANITFFSASVNKLTGPLPAGIFAAQFIELIDLGNNSLSGDISTDIPWAQIKDKLVWVDLSFNQLAGTMPKLPLSETSDFQVTTLLLAGNKITGTLDAFASSLTPPDNQTDPAAAPISTNPILRLDLSGNQLTGTVPRQLGYLAAFYGFFDAWSTRGFPIVLDLSNNELTGTFPMWIYPAVAQAAIPVVGPYVSFNGNQLTCPPPGSVNDIVAAYQRALHLTCYDAATGEQVDVLEALQGTSGDHSKGGTTLAGSRVSANSAPGTRAAAASSGGGNGTLSPGAIAGVVIGAVVGFCALAVLAALVVARLKKRTRQTYQDVDQPAGGKDVALPRLPQSTFVGQSNIV